MITGKLTPNEERLLEVLKDGQFHPGSELLECLSDGVRWRSLSVYVCTLRKKLMKGYLILCVMREKKRGYRMVRSINSTE